ncbi:isocitrate lyase/phosphoenolpyruvate mutase family protein [Nocardia sp. NPDC020380]|uniref:isocitrate lyase/phosphoenolpyruvate mutase family protein n=1 Tax=Nocardia sp. NPDC020380 TaxID=3364309 RepID=UPI00378CF99E
MTDQAKKAALFRALHERPEPFLIPNPWDAGTARILTALGFEALATTSSGVASSRGRSRATAEQILDNCREIDAATDLPLNADLENGFADDPAEAAAMVVRAAATGAVGASIEDATGNGEQPIYEFGLAVERVRAAAEAAHGLPIPLLLTARAENLLHGVGDLDETIRRLQAFEAAGADVLFAPGLRTAADIRAVVSSVGKPVNVLMGTADPSLTLERLGELGVRRVSIGGGLSRAALQAFKAAATEMRSGRFDFVAGLPGIGEI